jgi:hypothetical protein
MFAGTVGDWNGEAIQRFIEAFLLERVLLERQTAIEPGLARNPKFLALDHKTMHICCA